MSNKRPLPRFKTFLLFGMQFIVCAVNPILSEYTIWDSNTKTKIAHFLPQAPYVVEFACVTTMSAILILIKDGNEEFKRCLKIKDILKMSPISFFHGISESFELIAFLYMDGTSRTIINQLKLLFVATISHCLLARPIPFSRALWITVIFLASVAFISWRSTTFKTSSQRYDYLVYGLCSSLIATFSGSTAGIFADYKLKKKDTTPFLVHMFQIRITTCLIVFLGMLFYALLKNEIWKILFYGWNWRVIGFTVWLINKDFLAIYFLKSFDALTLTLCQASSIGFIYFLDSLCFNYSASPTSFCLLLITVIALIGYTFEYRNKKDEPMDPLDQRQQVSESQSFGLSPEKISLIKDLETSENVE